MNVIPYSEEFEKAVIVSALVDPQLLPKISNLVEPADFYIHKHREIFSTITTIEPDNLDSLAVQDRLSEDTKVYFNELVEDSERILPSISNALYYAETIRNKSKLRAGIELGQNIIATCFSQDAEEAIPELEEMFARFLEKRVLEDKSESTHESFKKFLATLHERTPDDPNATRTGFRQLDLMMGRMEGMCVLAAKTSVGKTSFALNVILNVLSKGQHVVFFSLEQPEDQIFERLLAIHSGIPLEDIRMGIADPPKKKVEELQEMMTRLHVDDTANIPTSYAMSVARQKRFEWGKVALIVVDYLHIMRLNDRPTVEALGDAVKELRGLGKELGCPVLLLSQLKREDPSQKKNKRPDLSDLRSSGEIEQSADQVIFLHRESYFDMPGSAPEIDLAEVLIRKNRNGRLGILALDWLPSTVSFREAK